MGAFSFDISAFSQISKDIQKIGETVRKNEERAVALAGNAYKSDVQRIIAYKTGTLRRSVHVELTSEGIRQVALIGTDVPYAKRVEYGFWDKTDSLGRHYMQYPRPAWRPAFDANKEKYGRIMISALNGTPLGDTGITVR